MVTATLKTDEGTNIVVNSVVSEVSPYKSLISGGMAGCIGKTLTAPLSRLTILYQVGPLLRTSTKSSTVVQQNSLVSLFHESKK